MNSDSLTNFATASVANDDSSGVWLLTFPSSPRSPQAVTTAVSDAGETPLFASLEDALAAGHRHGVERPRPVWVPAEYAARLTCPRPYDQSAMTFEAAASESRRALTRKR